jgi:hypothetical protein
MEWLADNILIESATTFSVYRGTFELGPWGYDHQCFDSGIVSGTIADGELPAANTGFYYLVAGNTVAGGDGHLGDSSVAASQSRATIERLLVERPNETNCAP